MEVNWQLRDNNPEISDKLARELSISKALSNILVARGISNVASAREFLTPRLDSLHDPFLFEDMEKATRRILQAVVQREKILIYGDYDVDGISSTAVLHSLLKMVDGDVGYHIPDRLGEGYGMRTERLKMAADDGVKLIITVDTGISGIEEITLAKEYGIDVVVTDHHEPGETLPPAYAIINPKLSDTKYPFRDLAGVGVAFKLAWAIAQSFSPTRRVSDEFREFLLDALALVSLGTVADVVPLLDENRVFVKFGLKALENTTRPGLRALLEKTGLAGRKLRSTDIAFRLAPRLNAAGRMGRSSLGMELFTTDSTREAERIAGELERENRNRQKIEAKIFENATQCLSEKENVCEKIIVLAQEGWHSGVTGIVAAKLADAFNRPVVLIAVNGETGKGSARSMPDVHIYDLLLKCSEDLIGFGGHAAAAGFEIHTKDIDDFCLQVEENAHKMIEPESLKKKLKSDMCCSLCSLSIETVRELEQLRPYGEGNPEPIFISDKTAVAGKPHVIGRDGKHVAMQLRTNNSVFRAVGFGMADVIESLGSFEEISVAYVPVINSWRGYDTVELELRDIAANGKSLVQKYE